MPRWQPLQQPLLAGALASFPGRRVARIIADSRVVRVKIIQTLLLNGPLAVLGVVHARGTLQSLQRGLTAAICGALGLPVDSSALGGLESASAAAIASLVLLPFLLVATVISTVWCGQIVREAVRLTTTAPPAATAASAAKTTLPTPQRTPRSSATAADVRATHPSGGSSSGGLGLGAAAAAAAGASPGGGGGGGGGGAPTSPPPAPPPPPPPPSLTAAAPRSPLLEAAEAIYRLLILTVLNVLVPVVDGVTASLLPWHIGRAAAVLLCALSIGFAAWDTVWSHQSRTLEWRCTAVEDTPAFYVGFGLATALATYWPNAYTSAAVYATMLPWLTLAALLHDKRQQALAAAAASGRGGSPTTTTSTSSQHTPNPARRSRGWLLRPVRWLLNGILWGLERLLASTHTHANAHAAVATGAAPATTTAPPPPGRLHQHQPTRPKQHGDASHPMAGGTGSDSSSSSKPPPR